NPRSVYLESGSNGGGRSPSFPSPQYGRIVGRHGVRGRSRSASKHVAENHQREPDCFESSHGNLGHHINSNAAIGGSDIKYSAYPCRPTQKRPRESPMPS